MGFPSQWKSGKKTVGPAQTPSDTFRHLQTPSDISACPILPAAQAWLLWGKQGEGRCPGAPGFLHELTVPLLPPRTPDLGRREWWDTRDMTADGLTKGSVDREPLLRVAAEGEWAISYDAPVWKTLRKDEGQE